MGHLGEHHIILCIQSRVFPGTLFESPLGRLSSVRTLNTEDSADLVCIHRPFAEARNQSILKESKCESAKYLVGFHSGCPQRSLGLAHCPAYMMQCCAMTIIAEFMLAGSLL